MATRESITGPGGFHIAPRPIAPPRLLGGGELDLLLGRGADVERALDRVAGPLDDFDFEPEFTPRQPLPAHRRGGRHA